MSSIYPMLVSCLLFTFGSKVESSGSDSTMNECFHKNIMRMERNIKIFCSDQMFVSTTF